MATMIDLFDDKGFFLIQEQRSQQPLMEEMGSKYVYYLHVA